MRSAGGAIMLIVVNVAFLLGGCSTGHSRAAAEHARVIAEMQQANAARLASLDAQAAKRLAFIKSQAYVDAIVECIDKALSGSVYTFSEEMRYCDRKALLLGPRSKTLTEEHESAMKVALSKAEAITASRVETKFSELEKAKSESQERASRPTKGCHLVTPLGDGQYASVDGGRAVYIQNAYLEGCD